MGILILPVILAAAFFAVGLGVHLLAELVRGDGSTQRSWTRTPPRSHPLDEFDPRTA